MLVQAAGRRRAGRSARSLALVACAAMTSISARADDAVPTGPTTPAASSTVAAVPSAPAPSASATSTVASAPAIAAAASVPSAEPRATFPARPVEKALDVVDAWYLAPGFTSLPAGARVALLVLHIDLVEQSVNGFERRDDWSTAAMQGLQAAMVDQLTRRGLAVDVIDAQANAGMAELLGLQAAYSRAIETHYAGGFALPAKNDVLDWSMGDTVRPLQVVAGTRYGLFVRIRDNFSSSGRIATMIATTALMGVPGAMAFPPGRRFAAATLVDLETGRVLWFNGGRHAIKDLRDADKFAKSAETLLYAFPVAK